MPIDRYNDEIQKSLLGGRLGFDNRDFLVGPAGSRIPTETATTAGVATPLTNYGLSVLTGSTATYLLEAPLVAGVEKIIVNASTLSTATMSVVRASSGSGTSFLATTIAGGTANGGVRLNLLNCGSAVRLVSISSAIWAPVGIGSSLYFTNSTSS